MNSQRKALFALFAALLLTASGAFENSLFSSAFSSQSTITIPPSTNSNLNGSSVSIPISMPPISEARIQSALPSRTPISFSVLISSRNALGLQQYINQISNPASPQYRHFLSIGQYSELYGPDSAEISSLTSYFSSKGLSVTEDHSNPNLLQVSGDALETDGALHVSLESFKVANQSFYSPLTSPELPSQYSFVQSISGLSNYGSGQNFAVPLYRTFGKISGQPQQSDSNSIYYTPSEIHQIYNSSSLLSAGYTGTGITIAIVDAYGDPYIQEEWTTSAPNSICPS